MKENGLDWELENKWLKAVLEEARKQLKEKQESKEKIKKETIETQRELWQEIGVLTVEQHADFMGYITAIKMQKRKHVLTGKFEDKYERMLNSPYFGRIDFLEAGKETAEKYYIGVSTLMKDNYDFLVYDWRAPVSSMFYDYETGPANYICPQEVIEGELTLKRQYKIMKGKIEYMFDSNLKIDDDILQDILGKSSDSKMKTIVTTIQREQNRVIRNEDYKNMIVLGPAGSGKTSVALHRIAYLLYKHRDNITAQNIIIFSPNDIFNDYISNVLPQLGEDNMYRTTFKDYMQAALDGELKKETYCEMMEFLLNSKHDPARQKRVSSMKFKSSLDFISILKQYVIYQETKDRKFVDIVFRGDLIISSKDLQKLFFEGYTHISLKKRLALIKKRIRLLLTPYKKKRIKEVAAKLKDTGEYLDHTEILELSITKVKTEMKEIDHEIERMTKFDLSDIYAKLFDEPEFFSMISHAADNADEIKSYTLESLQAGRLCYEDQVALLYLQGELGDLPKTSSIKYVVIDEAQDYTPLQYEILYQLFGHAAITILGDFYQSIHPYMNLGSYANISHIFSKNHTCIIHLNKSYRSTVEITRFSRKLLNNELTEGCIERNGKEPDIIGVPEIAAVNDRLPVDIKEYLEKGYRSIGIITRTVNEADEIYGFLSEKTTVNVIRKDDDEYANGVLIIPAYLAKGLEFDVVIIYDAGNEKYGCEEERLLLYTACTRALHDLRLYHTGKISSLIEF